MFDLLMAPTCILALCTSAISEIPQRHTHHRAKKIRLCEKIGAKALAAGLDPSIIIAVAWRESAISYVTNKRSGATGPLQILPRYWCRRGRTKGCDLIAAGLQAFKIFSKRRSLRETLCRYSSGRSCREVRGARRYAGAVFRTLRKIRAAATNQCSWTSQTPWP